MDKANELRQEIFELEKIYQKKKNKINLYTFIFLGIAFYICGIWFGYMNSVTDYLSGIVISYVFAGFYMFISILVFTPIFNCCSNEIESITRLKTKLQLLEKDNYYM